MDRPTDPPPSSPTPAAPARPEEKRRRGARGPAVIGVIALSALMAVGTWFRHRGAERAEAARAILAEVAARRAVLDHYRARFQNLQWNAAKLHAWADPYRTEPMQSWARERVRRFDALVGRIDRGADERRFDAMDKKIASLCAAGEFDAAREWVAQLPEVTFPDPAEFRRLQAETYLNPLTEFSRRTPDYYRAFQSAEPAAAAADIAELRRELVAADIAAVTPQTMFKLELLTAVAPENDPVLADWSAITSAGDYFENPDAETLAHWRRAQQAVRRRDWSTAVEQMQSILLTTVRTRQPFRAAFGWARLSNRPDQPAEAYPFLQEAASSGDRQARAWVAQEDDRQGRSAQALRWLEAAVADGETEGIPRLLALYAMDSSAVPRDAGREAETLHRIITAPDAPPLASLLLGRLYESGEGVAVSAAQAFVHYRRAAEKGLVEAWPEVARCHLRGVGTPANDAQALAWAGRAFAAGEREKSVPILMELMQRDPDRASGAIAQLFENEQTAAPAGFQDNRVAGPGIQQLQLMLAHHFDEQGRYGQAARAYAQAGDHNHAAATRLTELTTGHRCPTCGGVGKVRTSLPCPTCGGKGTVNCSHCDGRGYIYEPGTPPCTTCGGSGTVMQDGHAMTCAACGGTGKGKGSVIKKDCVYCVGGRVPCPDCTNRRIVQEKECPDCHGTGLRALADD